MMALGGPAGSAPGVAAGGVDGGSFRDRQARVVRSGNRILRALSESAMQQWRALAASRFLGSATAAGRLIRTRELSGDEFSRLTWPHAQTPWAGALEHEVVPFVSYPYEWCFSMLKDAALLQLDLLSEALEEDFVCKDASPYNVQFWGGRPVFIDVPSFERLQPGQVWSGYRQFCQLFLYPLMLCAYRDVDFHPWLRGSIDGVDPRQISRLLGGADLLRAGVLSHVRLQAGLASRLAAGQQSLSDDLRRAGFDKSILLSNVRSMRSLVTQLRWRPRASTWSDYASRAPYAPEEEADKRAFVASCCDTVRPALAWDLGSNTGVYARLASADGARVIAMDADHAAVEKLYASLDGADRERILPLRMDVADPSPALGWRGLERKSLDERGKPDLTLCLALTHHICIGGNVPLREWLDWLASLEGDLVIEFVGRDDPQVQGLLANKTEHYEEYHQARFDASLRERFEVLRIQPLGGGTRVLYHARPLA